MAGVTSPKIAWATTMPMGPSTASASITPRTTGFSPVAPQSAPAFNMVAVAMLLVPRAHTSAFGRRALTPSTSSLPRRPPWPSMTTIFISLYSFLICSICRPTAGLSA